MRIITEKTITKFALPKVSILFLILFIFSLASTEASAQKYPQKPIEVILGYEAGGGGDVLLRIITKHLSKEMGQPFIVINKSGGAGIPATLDVMKAKPDGYTILSDATSQSSYQIGRKDVPFDPLERSYICKVATVPYALFCDPKLPWKSLKDAADFIKEQPEKFVWGGIGGPGGVTYSQLKFFTGIGADINKLKRAWYKGSGPILIAVAGGHIMFGSSAASGVPTFQQGGLVRTLVVTGDKPLKSLPGVPSAKESGYPFVNTSMWSGFSGPPNLPKEVVDTINKAVKKIMQAPEFIADLEKVSSVPDYAGPEELKNFIIEEGKEAIKWREMMGW